jgi:hypothetical protein
VKEVIVGNRIEFPAWLNANGLNGDGVEIGVMNGTLSEIWLSVWKHRTYFMVDPWERQPADVYKEKTDNVDYDASYRNCQGVASRFPGVVLIKKYSVDASKDFQDASLDFAYIDANHSFESVWEDMNVWWPKVKSGGVLCGHDYEDYILWPHFKQVKSAVDKWMKDRGLHFIVTTECQSWWCVKP